MHGHIYYTPHVRALQLCFFTHMLIHLCLFFNLGNMHGTHLLHSLSVCTSCSCVLYTIANARAHVCLFFNLVNMHGTLTLLHSVCFAAASCKHLLMHLCLFFNLVNIYG